MSKVNYDVTFCVEQRSCPLFSPLRGPSEYLSKAQGMRRRKDQPCKFVGDDHRCGSCSYGSGCGRYDWVCTNINVTAPDGHSRKRIKVIIRA